MSFYLFQNCCLATIVSDDSCCHVVLVYFFEERLVFESALLGLGEAEGGISWKLDYIVLHYHLGLNDLLTLVILDLTFAFLVVDQILFKF